MVDGVRRALLIMDCQKGAADQAFAASAVQAAAVALQAARRAKLLVAFTKIDFLPAYADVSPANKTFSAIKAHGLFAPGTGTVVPQLEPSSDEVVFTKDRFNAFCGNALRGFLRAQSVTHLVLAGISTSGVVLSTFADTIDRDFDVTILSDACADSDGELHAALMTKLFPRSATVLTTNDWAASLV